MTAALVPGNHTLYMIFRSIINSGWCAANTKKLAPLTLKSIDLTATLLAANFVIHHRLGTPKTTTQLSKYTGIFRIVE
jgi:hypothetical protein